METISNEALAAARAKLTLPKAGARTSCFFTSPTA